MANPDKLAEHFFGLACETEQCILEELGMPQGQFPFKYLGVPYTYKKLYVSHCLPLVEAISAKIKHWTGKFLAYSGRFLLIKSVLSGI